MSLKQRNMSSKERNLSMKEANLSLKEANLSLKEANLSLKEANLSSKEANLSSKQRKMSSKQRKMTLKQRKMTLLVSFFYFLPKTILPSSVESGVGRGDWGDEGEIEEIWIWGGGYLLMEKYLSRSGVIKDASNSVAFR